MNSTFNTYNSAVKAAGGERCSKTAYIIVIMAIIGYSYISNNALPQDAKPSLAPEGSAKGDFDLAANELPKGYITDNIVDLYNSLITSPKGEYETTEQYNKRKTNALTKHTYAFSIDSYSAGEFVGAFTYNADKQECTGLLLRDAGVYAYSPESAKLQAYLVKSVQVSKRSYEASNAFGVTVQVKETSKENYCICWPTSGKHSLKMPSTLKITFKLPVDEAKYVKEYLSMLVICTPYQDGTDLTLEGGRAVQPTLDSPRASTMGFHYIKLRPKEIWVYHLISGKVYKKQPLK